MSYVTLADAARNNSNKQTKGSNERLPGMRDRLR